MVAAAAEELDVARHDLDDPLLALRVLVGAVLEAPLDVERVALLDVLAGRLGQALPANDAVKLRFLLAVDRPVGREADARNGLPPDVCRSSASRVALPTRMTLLTPLMLTILQIYGKNLVRE